MAWEGKVVPSSRLGLIRNALEQVLTVPPEINKYIPLDCLLDEFLDISLPTQPSTQTPTQSLIKVYLSEDGEDKRRTNHKEIEEADDMMLM